MIIAIDPSSSSLGYALFTKAGDLVAAGSVKSTLPGGALKRFEITTKLAEAVKRDPLTTLVCEEPKLGGRWQTASQTGMDKLLGQLEFWFLDNYGVSEVSYFHPMTIKAQIGGSGKASKLDVALGAGEFLSSEDEKEVLAKLIDEEDFDATDAIAVGLTHINLRRNNEN